MTEFQAGDIVECVGASSGGFTAGRFYALSEGDSGAVKVRLDDRGSKTNGWLARNFKLAFRPPAGEVWEPWNGSADTPEIGRNRPLDLFCGGAATYRNQHSAPWNGPHRVIAYRVIPAQRATIAEAEACMADQGIAPIDPDKIRPGDEVTVRARVLFAADEDGDIKVQFPSSGVPEHELGCDSEASRFVAVSAIVTHTPKAKPLEAGDNVRSHTFPGVMTIRAIDAGHAWVGDCIYALGDLERAD